MNAILMNQPFLYQDMLIEQIWTNSATTSNFAAQTVSIDLSDYQWVAIRHKYSTTASGNRIQFGKVGTVFTMDAVYAAGGNVASRACTLNTGSIVFNDTDFDKTVNNKYIIPVAIYGIKRVRED